MGVLADWQIKEEGIITPFTNGQKVEGVLSFGVGHYGYDLRCSDEFHVFSPAHSAGGVINPKNFDKRFLVSDPKQITRDGAYIIPPNSFALTQTIEHFRIPRSVLGIVLGKSTYARCGIIVNCTPLEPEWRGRVTIEISNTTPLPAMIFPNEGIAQVIFHRADGPVQVLLDELVDRLTEQYSSEIHVSTHPRERAREAVNKLVHRSLCKESYEDKGGRYQDQGAKVVLPCVRGQTPLQVDGLRGTGHNQ